MANEKNIVFDISKKINEKFWELRECPICGTKFYARKKYRKLTCGEECYKRYIEINKEEINKKRSLSCYKSYHSKDADTIAKEHEKAKQTSLQKYGVEKPQKTEEYRNKMSVLMKGKDWTKRNEANREKLIIKYKEICSKDNLELIEFRNRFDCTVKCLKCGDIFDVHILGYLSEYSTHNLCRHCHPNLNSINETKPSKFVEDILIKNNIDFLKNTRKQIPPYEIDIYIPSLKVGFEINGNFWHSEIGGHRDKTYHITKTKMANDKGIKLIHIYEDEIVNKPSIVESRILNIIGKTPNKIYARKCEIKEITYSQKKLFFDENHIDGDSISKYNVGLFYNDELVCSGSFGMRKISGKTSFELIRFANKINHNVIGGFSKILSYVKKTYSPSEINTYADIRWSGLNYSNTVYYKNGFDYCGTTTPNYYYMDRKNYLIRINRLNFTKEKLRKMGFDITLTESEIMFNNGYDKIYDCGSMKFVYKQKMDAEK